MSKRRSRELIIARPKEGERSDFIDSPFRTGSCKMKTYSMWSSLEGKSSRKITKFLTGVVRQKSILAIVVESAQENVNGKV